MDKRLQKLGIGLVVMGLVFFVAGGYTLYKTQQGAGALQAFSAAQNVTLTYDDQKNTLYQSRAIAAGFVAPK